MTESQTQTQTLIPTFDRTFPITTVRRWYERNKFMLYIFVGKEDTIPVETRDHIKRANDNTEYWNAVLTKLTGFAERPTKKVAFVYATIWPDDNITYALTKILNSIKESNKTETTQKVSNVMPFAWNHTGILRFSWPTLNIKAGSVDPWNMKIDIVEKQPVYNSYQLIETTEINIVIYDDIKSALTEPELHMYFPDARHTEQLIPARYIHLTESYLQNVWSASPPEIKNTSSKLKGVIFEASFDPSSVKNSLADIFENKNATKRTPLIQWCDDITRVIYKLYKKHNIRTNDLRKWIDRYNIPKVPCIIMYDVWNKSSTYTMTKIQEDGKIQIEYIIDSSDTTFNTIEDVKEHVINAVNIIKESLDIPILDVQLADISYDIAIQMSVIGLNEDQVYRNISDALGKAIPLFYMIYSYTETRKKRMVFRRASNLTYPFSLPEIIQSLLDYGVYTNDIKERLISFGYDKKEIEGAMDEVGYAHSEGKYTRPALNFDIEEIIMMTLNYMDGTLYLGIKHSPNIEEAKRALKWLSSLVFDTIHSMHKEAERYEIIPIEKEVKKPEQEKEEKKPKKEKETPSSSSSSSFEFEGGAKSIKKTGDGFLLERLQKADRIIFANDKTNYARGCQQDRQPLLMTKAEWELSKTKVANSILYRNNYYTCPSIWCKTEGVAITKEELAKNNGKCPKTNEKPVVLWDEPKDRFVGFNKNIITENGKNIYSPCCFKSDQFEKAFKSGKDFEDLIVYRETGLPVEIEKKQDKKFVEKKNAKLDEEGTYIFKKDEPVPSKGRYGSVPLALYRLFFPEYAEQTNNIATQPTIVRHGIGTHTEDSLMISIAYALGMDSKEKLIKEIIKVLDPLTFISLEGGAVLSAFINDGVPQISYKSWYEWISEYPDYMSRIGIRSDTPEHNTEVIREMKIYEAYLRFIHHLQSNDEKNTRMLYNLLAYFGVFLMIWERDRSADTVKLSCPYFIGYEDMAELITRFKNRYIMLLHHGSYKYPYYEPLEIRALNTPPIKEIPIDDYPMVHNMALKCPVAYQQEELETIEKLRGLIYWTNSIFEFSSKQYMPNIVVLGADLRIEGIITRGSIWIQFKRPSLEILPRLMDMLKGMKMNPILRYHEDIDTEEISARFSVINRTEYEIWKRKCQTIGFNIFERIPPPSPVVPVVSIMSQNYQDEFVNINKEMLAVRDIQLKIAKYLLYQYDNKVKEHIRLPRKEFISVILEIVLKDLWKKGTDNVNFVIRKKVKTAIEEMPLIYGRDSLQKWIHTIRLTPYRFYDSSVYTSNESKDNWMFSQLAIEVGLPKDVMAPSAAITPKTNSVPEIDDVYPITITEQRPEDKDIIPMMAKTENIRIEDMPSKWKKANIRLMHLKKNKMEYIPNLTKWLAAKIRSPFTWEDIVHARYIQIASYFGLQQNEFKEVIGALLQEPTFRKVLIQTMKQNKSIKDDELLNYMWSERAELTDKLKQISEMNPTPIWPMDIDFRIMAQMFDMFVLIIYRKPYSISKKEKDQEKDQTDIEKLRLSSILYSNRHTSVERPLLMIYREKDTEKGDKQDKANMYSLIVSGKSSFYFSSATDASAEIQAIIKAHRDK